MSKFKIVESGGAGKPASRYFQVYIGTKAIGEPWPTKDEALAFVKLLEDREIQARKERDSDFEP